jgi:hypothetical protein
MTSFFHFRVAELGASRWALGLCLASVLALAGCKQLGPRDDAPHDGGLRRNDLAEPARQLRSSDNPDKDKKPANDPLMSSEAQKVYHDLD